MSEDDAFLAAIRAQPTDDTVRLVYADWLDERCDPRGEFLRHECHLHRMAEGNPKHRNLQGRLSELGRQLDHRWLAAICRVHVDLGGSRMNSAMWSDPTSGWTVTAGGMTSKGEYRQGNQDHFLLDSVHPIALVLDGMGDHEVGERAAAEGAVSLHCSLAENSATGDTVEGHITRSLRAANDAVRRFNADPNHRGAGTTVVLVVFRAGRVFVSWVGDSVCYRASSTGVRLLTRPHDFRNWLARRFGLTEDEMRGQKVRNVLTHYLGAELPDPIEVLSDAPRPGDRLILATDGAYALLDPNELLTACRLHPDPLACSEYLVRQALDRGSRDNATCVVISFEGTPKSGEPELPGSQPKPSAHRPWWRFWERG